MPAAQRHQHFRQRIRRQLTQTAAASARRFITSGRLISSNSSGTSAPGFKNLGLGTTELRYTLRGDASLDGTHQCG
ncbi:MAG TPA: hypothetical protein VLI90_15680 [Tepidisphaeraceae bacterium]|nr:hypothetical protein [Tepidisphaeraceae bacterium]